MRVAKAVEQFVLQMISQATKIKIGIIEDDASLLKNLHIFLGNFPDLQIVFSFSNYYEFERNRKHERFSTPDIILIDGNDSADKQRFDTMHRFVEIYPATRLLAYTDCNNENDIIQTIGAGASGYLLKTNTLYDVYSAIKECYDQGGYVSPAAVLQIINYIQRKQPNTILQDDWNTKQREVIACLQQGLSYEEISLKLGISRYTVNYHVQRIFRKMMVKSRVELIYKLSKTDTV